jgi:A/G-specific adenine glycosylase
VDLAPLRSAVLSWFGPRSPYRTLVSEVMLQQTQAARVEPIFESFIARFPDVGALAEASRADVLRSWAGLGYNRRGVALHEAAQAIVRDHGGRVPRDRDTLLRLPGVGPYTAAAVASIGHGEPAAAVDTNVRRITARVVHGVEPDEVSPDRLARDAQSWLDPSAPGEWNQALMDLGRVFCRPAPRCADCPLASFCRFRAAGRTARPSGRRQSPFQGSARQVRGAVVAALRTQRSATGEALADRTGHPARTTATATESLLRDGILERTRSGRYRLAVR